MWDPDDPDFALLNFQTKGAKDVSKEKKTPTSINKDLLLHFKSSKKLTSTSSFCTVGPEASSDSDSSSGSDIVKKLDSQAPTPKPRSSLSGKKTLAPEQHSSVKVRETIHPPENVRLRVCGNVEKTKKMKENISEYLSSGHHVKEAGRSSSKEDLSLKQYLFRKPERISNTTQGVELRSDGKYVPYQFNADRVQKLSKCEEKLNLGHFLSKDLRTKAQDENKNNSKSSQVETRRHAGHVLEDAEFLARVAAMKIDSSKKNESCVAVQSTGVVAGRPGSTGKQADRAARPRPRCEKSQDDSGSSDDTTDESLEMLLPASQQYIPPRRHLESHQKLFSDDAFPALGSHSKEIGKHHTVNERERNNAAVGNGGAGLGENKTVDGNSVGRNMRGWGNYGRNNWRDNQADRNPFVQDRIRERRRQGALENRRLNRGHYNEGNDDDLRRHQQQIPQNGHGNREQDQERGGNRYQNPEHGINAPHFVRDHNAGRDPERRQNEHHGGGNRHHNRPQPERFRPLEVNLSFTRLRELKSKDSAEVVAALSYSKEGLSRLLKNEQKLTTDSEMMHLLLGSLAKVSLCHSMPAQTNEILNIVRSSKFLYFLGTFISSVTGQGSQLTHIIGESADLLRTLITLFPSALHEVLMVNSFMEIAQKQAKQRGAVFSEEITKKLDDFEIAKDAAVEGLRQKQARVHGDIFDEDSLTPPDDFRQISVFPTMEDLDKKELPFLRKNKEVGSYSSVDHYLDVQFRLLREDFVYPLREGIAEYLAMIAAPHTGKKLKDIRVYHDVHILRAVCLQNGLGHRLTFDISRFKHIRWEVSKRLIYGSLVCLSADNFRTLYFATVSNREPSDLREGVLDVMFEHNLQELAAIPPETVFTMAETTAFFEAYRHVLAGLQRIRDTQLSFQRYIVTCEKTVSAPKYDLRPLVDEAVMLREDQSLADQGRDVAYDFCSQSKAAESIPVLHREDWPDPQLLKLDQSQFEALHCALSKEFSVIQGPPGTGKTYVGLKIVKALLHNRKAWDPDLNSCMLIVCYTNHALDQFIEGVVSFFSGQLVRVGSRLRSEKLEKYSLSNLRWNMRRQRDNVDRDFREITRLRFQGYEALDRLKSEIDFMGLKVESAKREILHEDLLQPHMLDKHYDRLLDGRQYVQMQAHDQYFRQGKTKKKVYCMPEWLAIGMVLQNTHVTAEDLEILDHDLGDDNMDIEGEIQALEEQNKLDVDDGEDRNDRKKKQKERQKLLAQERSSYLAVDLSKLDQGPESHDERGGGFQIPRKQWRKIKQKLRRNVQLDDKMTEAEEKQVEDLWMLNLPERWRLYRRWTYNLCQSLLADMRQRERLYDELAKRQQETLMQEDKHIMKTATVIAMTTTAAARYQTILQEVQPKVIVVEEAAEVLEGHVITTLNQDCQHLILIGDHKQLRPNPTVFKLAQKYNLELSLFERMINNDLRCFTLNWQHRMRPEIASLIKPIYPSLQNHTSVNDYEPVKGVSSNIFFICHSEPETHDDETKSHSNLYEAQYLTKLCAYLLKQGYDASQITVLTTYSGQLFQLRKLMPKKSFFDGVRVTVVDNFQGEENDIILLSLVRSNEDGNIGFLKIENRVCVALSRAKMGLYVISNFDLLSASSRLWQTITTDLRRDGKIGETLNLYCQNHPRDKGLAIKVPEDFDMAPEGGCMKPCTARLDCGHVCTRMCHPYDKEHKEYRCSKKCERKMPCEYRHPCRKLCYQECGECDVLIEKVIPSCGHRQYMRCSVKPSEFICQEDCNKILICGHKCGDRCGERHQCFEMIVHIWPCGHQGKLRCRDKETAPCEHPCGQQLLCGHECAGTCNECHSGRLHKHCQKKCTNILMCGHACRDTCSNCPPCEHKCENSCVHSTCQKRCGLLCVPCKEPCAWRCPHNRCSKLCGEPCNRPRCNEPCPKLLPCHHPCIGLCGEPCPKLCRICQTQQVTDIFFGTEDAPDARFVQLEDCEHIFEVNGLDHWMATTTGQNEDTIQLKACPLCSTKIRRNLRYGAIIKTQLKDIETVKGKMIGDERKRKVTLAELQQMMELETDPDYKLKQEAILDAGDEQTLGGVIAMINQLTLLKETKKIRQLYNEQKILHTLFFEELNKLEKWICSPRLVFTDQESADVKIEILRLQHWLSLLNYEMVAAQRNEKLPPRLADPMKNMIHKMKVGLPYTNSQQSTTKELLKQLEAVMPASGLGISDSEREMIVSAMQLSQGHWFKCPKGHIYAIGECGGATEESRCPECQTTIGGTNHQLRSDNALASEMDGARHSAWSEMANLGNFRLADLV